MLKLRQDICTQLSFSACRQLFACMQLFSNHTRTVAAYNVNVHMPERHSLRQV